jgi:hypothetical protein
MGEAQEKKIAYHRLRLEDDTMVEGPLVVVYREGVMQTFYPLEREEAGVIWRGGVGTPRI